MKANISNTDKLIRISLAIVLVILFFTGVVPGVLGYVFLALAAILILTSIISFCPIYAVLGFSTKKRDQSL